MTRADGPWKRLNLEFSQKAYENLQRLVKETDAASNAEAIRAALRLYDYLLRNTRDGWSIRLVRRGRKTQELQL